jgi:hypothetical protein
MSDDDNSIIGGLKKMAELEGYKAGTPANERRVRQLKVIKCREIRGVPFCTECKFFDYCELIKQVMREQNGYEE